MAFNINTFDVKEYDRILACGLSQGLGTRGKQVCIEAAICQVLGLRHKADPGCVALSVRSFKINLNDSPRWGSPIARAHGLHDLGLAQLGSLGVVNDKEFANRLAEKTIRILIPRLFREVLKDNPKCMESAKKCERKGTREAAAYAASSAAASASAAAAASAAANAAASASAAAYAAASAAASASAAAAAASAAANACAYSYLKLSASLALEVLRELNSPGIALLR